MSVRSQQIIQPVILSGGSGSRLWPVSRTLFPKQLLPIASTRSMLQDTAQRFADLDDYADPMVICNEEHRFAVAEQMAQIDTQPSAIILEPEGRNTGPAAAVAALAAARKDPDCLVLLLASDAVIGDVASFHRAIADGVPAAQDGKLVVFGARPTRPETGYGYIRRGAELDGVSNCFLVDAFVEKPDFQTAKQYLAAGDHFWNISLFLFSASSFLEEMRRLQPEMLRAAEAALDHAAVDLDFTRLDRAAFSQAPADSIDYAIMEHTDRAAMVPTDIGWSDVGSWTALWDIADRDENENATQGDVLLRDVRHSLIRAESRLVAAVGVEDLVVVETADAVLVLNRNHAQDVKAVVEQLKAANRPEAGNHKLVHRPWGSYEGLDAGLGYQVKRISVKPGGTLSLQNHARRAEHWVVIKGTATVTRGSSMDQLEVTELGTNQSIDIPLGAIHRLANRSEEPLVIIEVQSGDYLGEDDITRFEDSYGRE